ncbi:MAG: hypothetical protein OEY59_11360 [Deltaproteobacteria bacterium]|nr:hypothetical protein [Deltaproteobacteria bacterium]
MSFPIIRYRNVSLFADEPFGLKDISFDLLERKKYHLEVETEEQLNSFLGLLEGRYKEQSGIIRVEKKGVTQSDRQLLGGKVYSKEAGSWLGLKQEFFFFDGKNRSKTSFINDISAKHIRFFPIYKLKGVDKIKFALLALTFQESGLILISRLYRDEYLALFESQIKRIFQKTRCTLCLITSKENFRGDPKSRFGIENIENIEVGLTP